MKRSKQAPKLIILDDFELCQFSNDFLSVLFCSQFTVQSSLLLQLTDCKFSLKEEKKKKPSRKIFQGRKNQRSLTPLPTEKENLKSFSRKKKKLFRGRYFFKFKIMAVSKEFFLGWSTCSCCETNWEGRRMAEVLSKIGDWWKRFFPREGGRDSLNSLPFSLFRCKNALVESRLYSLDEMLECQKKILPTKSWNAGL